MITGCRVCRARSISRASANRAYRQRKWRIKLGHRRQAKFTGLARWKRHDAGFHLQRRWRKIGNQLQRLIQRLGLRNAQIHLVKRLTLLGKPLLGLPSLLGAPGEFGVANSPGAPSRLGRPSSGLPSSVSRFTRSICAFRRPSRWMSRCNWLPIFRQRRWRWKPASWHSNGRAR